jgi:ADP-ribose pyrophosphatase YjhB (NUDIX family)
MATATKVDAIVVFVDIRGFTTWSTANEVFEHSPDLIEAFYLILKRNFPKYWMKPLGDGAMLVREQTLTSKEAISRTLAEIIQGIQKATTAFHVKTDDFQVLHGHPTSLALGWGITRGTVNRLIGSENERDYIGADINKANRLCTLARPSGIVIDRFDFPEIADSINIALVEQVRRIPDVDDSVPVWVTEEIVQPFYMRENLRETPEVHVAGYAIRRVGDTVQILLAKRTDTREVFPGVYEGCGGQLRRDETFEQGVVRHFRTEMQITVRPRTEYHYLYTIAVPRVHIIPGIAFLCEYVEGEPSSPNHSAVQWITVQQFTNMSPDALIPGTKKSVAALLKRYREESH